MVVVMLMTSVILLAPRLVADELMSYADVEVVVARGIQMHEVTYVVHPGEVLAL